MQIIYIAIWEVPGCLTAPGLPSTTVYKQNEQHRLINIFIEPWP